jgi:hypothetical protein
MRSRRKSSADTVAIQDGGGGFGSWRRLEGSLVSLGIRDALPGSLSRARPEWPISGRSRRLARVFSGVLELWKRFWMVNSSL